MEGADPEFEVVGPGVAGDDEYGRMTQDGQIAEKTPPNVNGELGCTPAET